MTFERNRAAGVVYMKTGKGRAEMAARALGLGARQRSVLVMVDGRKTDTELAALMAPGVVDGILDQLVALELVAPEADDAPAMSAALAQAKARMTATAESCLGLLAAEVVRRIERASDAAALLGVLGHWHMALQDSKQGKAIALAQVEEIRASLAGA